MIKATVLILTKNSEKYLARVLESVKDFSEVVVYDSGSTDNTAHLVQYFIDKNLRESNACKTHFVVDKDWKGFGIQRQKSLALASNDWIFWLDSDEIPSSELVLEISQKVTQNKECAYKVQRLNHFNEKEIQGTDWAHDKPLRLFNKRLASFDDAPVHESVRLSENTKIICLQSKLLHFPYSNLNEFFEKTVRYTELSLNLKSNIKTSSCAAVFYSWTALSRGVWAFFRSYFLRLGFRDGFEGFVISYMNGLSSTVKHLKRIEIESRRKT